MKKLKFSVKIKWGLEICYLPGIEVEAERLRRSSGLDFLTGSIHWIENWGFDHKKEFWKNKNVDDIYKKYFDLEIKLIKSRCFDNIAHPDSIKCFDFYPTFDLKSKYEEIALAATKNQITFEQSSGLANNYDHKTIGMERDFILCLKKHGLNIITASDAHRPEDVGRNIKKAIDILESV